MDRPSTPSAFVCVQNLKNRDSFRLSCNMAKRILYIDAMATASHRHEITMWPLWMRRIRISLIQTQNNNNLTSLKRNLKHAAPARRRKKREKLRHKLSGHRNSVFMFYVILCFWFCCSSCIFSFSFSVPSVDLITVTEMWAPLTHTETHTQSQSSRVYSLCTLFHSFFLSSSFRRCTSCSDVYARAFLILSCTLAISFQRNVQNRKIPRCLFEINNTYC